MAKALQGRLSQNRKVEGNAHGLHRDFKPQTTQSKMNEAKSSGCGK
jgi:hypothetical protein